MKWAQIRIEKSQKDVYQLNRLQHQKDGNASQHLVAQADERNDQQAANGIKQQNVTVIKHQIQHTPRRQQNHPPYKPRTKIYPLLGLIVMLDIETQPKEHGKDAIHLASKHKEYRIPDGSIQSGRFNRIDIEPHVFQEVNQYDAGNGNSTKNVSYIHTCIGKWRRMILIHSIT